MLDQLTSRNTLHAAFDRVRENGGCRGSDGVSIADFHDHLEIEIDHLQDRLIRRRYHPLPLLRFQVPKNETRLRSLSVPTVRDRVAQTAVYQLTREIFEAEFEDCSYAFREGRSVKDAVHRIDELRRVPSPARAARVRRPTKLALLVSCTLWSRRAQVARAFFENLLRTST